MVALTSNRSTRWLQARGFVDMINASDEHGLTPLVVALGRKRESTARWMVANGADVSAVDNRGRTVLAAACVTMSPDMVKELADMVPREHLALRANDGHSPFFQALW